jgi:hypothetical protein
MYEEEDDGEEKKWLEPVAVAQPPVSALAYLQSIYCNPAEPEGRRLRAAVAALPFESPKLSATTVVSGQDFGAMLERAIERGASARSFKPIAYGSVREAEQTAQGDDEHS